MYGKLFEQMYDGTLSADWKAMVTFQQMIILANEDVVIDITPPALARKTGIPIDIIEHGVEKLEQPDKYSRSQDQKGRRIIRLDDHRPWGWFIVNYKRYRDMVRREDKKRADRERIAAKRNGSKINDVAECRTQSQPVAEVAHTHTDTDTDINTDKSTTAPAVPAEFSEFKKAYPERSGAQPWSRALKTIRARLKEGSQWTDILAGARRYAAYCDAADKTGTEYVMQASTFCDPDKHFLEPWELPPTKSELRQGKNIDAGQEFLEASSGQ